MKAWLHKTLDIVVALMIIAALLVAFIFIAAFILDKEPLFQIINK